MARLPFVVQPRQAATQIQIGNEESGVIEITRYGYLRTVEKALYQTAKPSQTGTLAAQTLARQLMGKHKITSDEAATVLGLNKNTLSPKLQKIQDTNGEEILKVLQQINTDVEQLAILQATVLLQQRVNPEWGAMDTAELHPDLIVGLSNLFVEEEQRSIIALKDENTDNTQKDPNTVADEEQPGKSLAQD